MPSSHVRFTVFQDRVLAMHACDRYNIDAMRQATLEMEAHNRVRDWPECRERSRAFASIGALVSSLVSSPPCPGLPGGSLMLSLGGVIGWGMAAGRPE